MRIQTTEFEGWKVTAIIEIRTISNQLYTDPFRIFSDLWEDSLKKRIEDACWDIVGENDFGSVKLKHIRGRYDEDSFATERYKSNKIIEHINK